MRSLLQRSAGYYAALRQTRIRTGDWKDVAGFVVVFGGLILMAFLFVRSAEDPMFWPTMAIAGVMFAANLPRIHAHMKAAEQTGTEERGKEAR